MEAGLPDGDAAGDAAGLTDAAGAGVDGAVLFCVAGSHANAKTVVARTTQKPKFKIPERDGLLVIVFFICTGQSRLIRRINRLQPRGSFSRSSLYSGPAIMVSIEVINDSHQTPFLGLRG